MLATIAQWFMGISLGTFFLHSFSLAIFMRPQDLKVIRAASMSMTGGLAGATPDRAQTRHLIST